MRAKATQAHTTVTNATWASLFVLLREQLPPSMQLEPLRAHACEDEERCVGTDMTGHCVCYAPAPKPASSNGPALGRLLKDLRDDYLPEAEIRQLQKSGKKRKRQKRRKEKEGLRSKRRKEKERLRIWLRRW